MKKLLTFFLTALLAFSVGWAAKVATYTVNGVSNNVVSGTLSGAPSGVTATVSAAYGYSNDGAQVTTKYTPFTITLKGFSASYKFTNITLRYCTNSSKGAGTVTARLGSESVANTFTLTKSGGTTLRSAPLHLTETSFNFNGSDLVITVNVTENSVYVNQLILVYEENGSTPPVAEDVTLSFPEASYTATLGQGFTAPTLSVTPDAAASQVSYTSSNTGVATVNATTGAVTLVGAGSTTITASVPASSTYNAATASYNLTVTSGGGPSLSTIYRKVTQPSDLVNGQKYIIMYENGSSSVGMGAISSSAGQAILNMAISNNQVDINGKDVLIMTLGGSNNAWTFATNSAGNGNYLAYSGSSTNINSNGTATDTKAQWTVSSTTNGFILVNNSATTRSIQYNGNAFKAYAQVESPAVLYVQVNSDAPMMKVTPQSLSIEDATGDDKGTITVTTQNLTDGISVSTTGDNWSVSTNSLTVDGGSVDAEYTGRLLAATGNVNLHTATADVDDVTVPVDYLYSGPIYIATDNGVQNDWNFSTQYTQMQKSGNVYTAVLNITAENTFIQFTQRVGDGITWGSKYFFGPVCGKPGDDWWLLETTMNDDVQIDATYSHCVRLLPGQWTVTVNAANNTIRFSPTIADPVIAPASGRYTDAQTVSITCETPGAHIYYTTDGTEPSLTNGTLYNEPFTVSSSTEVKAVAVLGTTYPTYSNIVTATYTIRALDGTDYLLTNAISINDEYVLVYSSNTTNYAMGAFNSNNYYAATTSSNDFELNGTIVTRKTNNVNVITLEPAGNNQYYIVDQDGYYLYYNSGNTVNHNAQLATDNNAYKWTITIDNDGVATIENVGTTGRYLRCNAQNSRYACYESTSNAKLYKRAISEPRIRVSESALDLGTVEAGGASVSKTFTVHGMNLTQDVTLSVADAENFTVQPTTISATDANNGYVTVTVTYTGSATTASTTVTVASANSEVAAQTVTVTAARTPLVVTISPEATGFTGRVQHVTIEANNPNATIYYSLDGENFVQYTGSFTHEVNNIGDSFTVHAYAVYNGERSSTVDKTYTRLQKESNLFVKVTDESQIIDDQKYIIVYEGNPGALYGNGLEANVRWDTDHAGHINIAGTDTYVFTLDGNKDNAKFKIDINGTTNYLSHTGTGGGSTTYTNTPESLTISSKNDGYSLTDEGGYYMSHNGSGNTFRWYNSGTNGSPVYLYVQEIQVEAPVITPATGEYSEHQNVTITAEDGTTIYYTTDGSDPTSSSTPYEGTFAVHYNANGPTTIKAIAVDDEGNVSTIAEAVYTWIAPKVTVRPATREVYNPTLTVVIGCNPVDATIYYTTDGSEPSSSNGTLYEGPFEVTFANLGDQVTVKAIAYNDDDVPSTVDVATYTYAEKVINVDAPFFSPLEGKAGGYSGIYYGNQTLEIATSTANADIYYVIEPVSGTTPPSSVSDPTKSSTHYSGPISMTVGNSYRVKAIAYIGDFASTISEGYYTILPFQGGNHVYQNLKDFNDNCPTGVSATFVNPVQVVYHSTYTNNGEFAEYCYLRDNTDYACVYFGKRDTHGYHIFEMGDWLDGSEIAGVTNIWKENGVEMNFHIQLGTSSHEITSWPTTILGNSEILPEEITNAVIVAGTAEGSNSWGHYVHLRNTTLRNVQDYSASDPKHTGLINDGTADANYYDKFYRWSEGTCIFNGNNDPINCIDNYDQAFFDEKQANGATFDVYGIVDYYAKYNPPFEICPLDFLWVYKPVITPASNDQCTTQQVVDITVETPEWNGAVTPTIYYKTDDMDDWAEFIGPFVVNSDTHVEAYAELPSTYGDMMHSVTVEADYKFIGIKEPIINDDVDDNVIEVTTGNEEVNVTISTNPESPDAVTLYTTNGEVPTLENGTPVENGEITLDPIKETTTVTAISYIEVSDSQGGTTLVWSKPVTQTYTFVKSNGIIYDLVNTVDADMVYVIVNKDAYMGLSTTQSGNNRGATGVMFTNDSKEHVYGNSELALFVLESASAGRYLFKNINGGGYLTVTTNDVANLSTSNTSSTYSEAAVTFGAEAAGYPATITFNYDGTNRYLRYFAKGRTFTTNSDATLNENVFLYGVTYGVTATPLAVIESEKIAGDNVPVTVADDLIGVWAVNKGTQKYVWAKDMGYSINKTSPTTGQKDYVRDVIGWQNRDWDQSNWVILDFSSMPNAGEINMDWLNQFVGKKLTGRTVAGNYAEGKNNGGNYRIVLSDVPTAVEDADAAKYPGLGVATAAIQSVKGKYNPANYELGYNTYLPGNFNMSNLNVNGNEGFVAGDDAAASHQGERLFFMNPKTQEVIRVWGVWDGVKFTVWESDQQHVNGWAVKGAFDVNWSWNARSLSPLEYGKPEGIADGTEHIFHAVVALKSASAGNHAPRRASVDNETPASDEYEIYPLDLSNSGNPTSVNGVEVNKLVESVRYYNIMGVESEQPFEGINIIVTRYNDGSISTTKVLR